MNTEPTDRKELRRQKVAIGIVIVACLLVYGKSVHYDFVLFDDASHTYDNHYLNPLTWSSFVHIWTNVYDRLYIPLSYTVYGALVWIGHVLGGPDVSDTGATINPHVFHAANVLLHSANSVLVYCILQLFTKRSGASLLGALVFTLHPLQVESVGWVSELRGLLSATCGLSAVLVYLRRAHKWYYMLVSVLMVAALLAKPSAVAFPIIAVIIDAAINKRAWREYALHALPWVAAAIAIAWLTGGQRSQGNYALVAPWQRTFVAADAIVFYFSKLLWPGGLAVDYGRTPQIALADRRVFIEWAIPPIIAAICWLYRKSAAWLAVGSLVALAALLPVLGLVPFTFQYYSTVADRYAYVAMLGPAIAVASLVARRPRWEAGAMVIVMALAIVSAQRCTVWTYTNTLMAAQMRVNSRSVFAHDAYGHIAERRGDYATALGEYRAVIAERVDLASGHYNAGRCLEALRDNQHAESEYITAIQMDPSYAPAHYRLGKLLVGLGRIKESDREQHRAVELDPYFRCEPLIVLPDTK
ncbi:MAG TPA: tetratricopeptide repeat protein [Capsulimonadaceae bacterium]|jgi:tetratricopeptide (TPR) repeat protein